MNKDEGDKILKDSLINNLLFNKYLILKNLGKGSFGKIYLCKDITTNKLYAAKIEYKNISANLLENEYLIMRALNNDDNIVNIPTVIKYGFNDIYNILIMKLLGKSLEQIFEGVLKKQKMSLRCICNLAIQMISILENIHNKNIIHRDIKPSNFLLNNDINNNEIYLIDFGLSKKYRESNNSNHYILKKSKKLTGTARFASVNAMEGITQSRRDDLESLGYVLIYFLKGKLPWQNIMIKNKEERYNKIKEIKKNIKYNELCKECPNEFMEYIKYIKSLQYEEEPNYNFLKDLFKNALGKSGFQFDYFYDWDKSDSIIRINNEYILENNLNDEEDNKLNLPLDKIVYKPKNKKRNISQDKSTNDGGEEKEESSSEQINFINNNECCIII